MDGAGKPYSAIKNIWLLNQLVLMWHSKGRIDTLSKNPSNTVKLKSEAELAKDADAAGNYAKAVDFRKKLVNLIKPLHFIKRRSICRTGQSRLCL